MNHSKFERRLLSLFALFFVCTFIMVLRGSLQTPERNSEEVSRLMEELDRLEKVLLEERKQLEALNRNIDAKLVNSHPRGKVWQQKEEKGRPKAVWTEPIPVLVFVCNRPEAAKEHLGKLISYRRNKKEQFPIIVSQDCDNRALQEAVKEFGTEVEYIKHISSETSRLKIPPEHKRFAVYYKIARHYRLALDHVFLKLNHTSVVITEDDLDIAPDFFDFFLATRPLLEADPSLFCVSAWNDNGKPGLIDPEASALLYRTDFFPGLGWMLTRSLWEEIGPRWPPGFWDDFLREPEQRRNRSCIRPEISRTAMTAFGRIGASKGLFFNRHLRRILLNQTPMDFTRMSLDHLLKERYEREFLEHVYSLPRLAVEELMGKKGAERGEFRIGYDSMEQFVRVAQRVGIMADTKAGVPRTAYLGVVSCFFNGNRLFIAPEEHGLWKGYDRRWEAPREILDGLQ